ncbi:hypothetical protein BC828DRAFT_412404 [Blastocladiella britannica]|nr:hypothetical protein BC828DRAFT_412404 [Blastocladiella britannica]
MAPPPLPLRSRSRSPPPPLASGASVSMFDDRHHASSAHDLLAMAAFSGPSEAGSRLLDNDLDDHDVPPPPPLHFASTGARGYRPLLDGEDDDESDGRSGSGFSRGTDIRHNTRHPPPRPHFSLSEKPGDGGRAPLNAFTIEEDEVDNGPPIASRPPPLRASAFATGGILSPTSSSGRFDPESLAPALATAHAAAQLTELAFLQQLLDPALSRHDVHVMVGTRVQRLIRDDDAGRLGKLSLVALAARRLPAIILTVVLEMGVGVMVGSFDDLLARRVVLVSFMPMISAICGNIGLQASTSTLRALATGHASHTAWSSVRGVLLRELGSGLALGGMLLVTLSIMVALWTWDLTTGFVAGFSILLSASMAGLMGSLAPLFFKTIGFDPALCAGPLETAVQDLVGISIYLTVASILL